MPHICLHGPVGAPFSGAVGTICARCGVDVDGRNMLMLDGLEGLGIGDVRLQICRFAQCRVVGRGRWKLVVLHNADLISPAGQAALRRVMEIYSRDTRFLLSTSTRRNIIAPLRSRSLAIFVPPSHPCQTPLRRLHDELAHSRNVAAAKAVAKLRAPGRPMKGLLAAADRFAGHAWETHGACGDLAFDWLKQLVGDAEK